jgi:hypothetical protein
MSLEEAFKTVEKYGTDYEIALVTNFHEHTVYFQYGCPDKKVKILRATICTADTWQNALIKLATLIQDGRI